MPGMQLRERLSNQYSALYEYRMDKKSSRTLILILTTSTYLLLGATVFGHLESEQDAKVREEIARIKERMQQKYNFSKYDQELLEIVAVKSIPHKAGLQWSFSGAFYFAAVVITTVGYGHSAPETPAGKIFCMLFAVAGIPLGLIMFQSIGERVNTAIAYCLHKIRRYLRTKDIKYLQEVTPTHLLIVSLSIGTSIIILGTYIFHQEERWSIFEAYYYCFITLSTIGFGDFVPLQQNGDLQARPGYVLFNLVFVFVGLAVFSACVNLLVLGFMAQNADEVTAAQREPQAAIVFERFARSGSLVDSQLFGVRRPSSVPAVRKTTELTFHSPRHISLYGRSQASKSQHLADKKKLMSEKISMEPDSEAASRLEPIRTGDGKSILGRYVLVILLNVTLTFWIGYSFIHNTSPCGMSYRQKDVKAENVVEVWHLYGILVFQLLFIFTIVARYTSNATEFFSLKFHCFAALSTSIIVIQIVVEAIHAMFYNNQSYELLIISLTQMVFIFCYVNILQCPCKYCQNIPVVHITYKERTIFFRNLQRCSMKIIQEKLNIPIDVFVIYDYPEVNYYLKTPCNTKWGFINVKEEHYYVVKVALIDVEESDFNKEDSLTISNYLKGIEKKTPEVARILLNQHPLMETK